MTHSPVVALDQTVAAHCVLDGVRTVPAAVPASLAASRLLRLRISALLAAHGVDFVHSNLDAVWLDDPRPPRFADPGLPHHRVPRLATPDAGAVVKYPWSAQGFPR